MLINLPFLVMAAMYYIQCSNIKYTNTNDLTTCKDSFHKIYVQVLKVLTCIQQIICYLINTSVLIQQTTKYSALSSASPYLSVHMDPWIHC